MRLGPAQLGILATAVAGLVCGCRIQRDFPSQPIQIVGNSYNPGIVLRVTPPSQPGADWSALEIARPEAVTAGGDGEKPAEALDALQARLVAKQRAKQAARRNLARQVESREIRPGVTLGEAIRNDAELRRRIEDVLRDARRKGVIEGEDGKCTVFLTVDFQDLKDALRPRAAPDASTSLTVEPVSPMQFRRRAQAEALESARMRALEHLKGVRLEGGDTLGKRMLADENLNRSVRHLVENLNPSPPSFRRDGGCEITLELDMADIQRLVEPRRRWPLPLVKRPK